MRFCTGLVLSCVQLCAVTGLAIRANMTSLKDITFGQLSYYDPKNQNESQTLFSHLHGTPESFRKGVMAVRVVIEVFFL